MKNSEPPSIRPKTTKTTKATRRWFIVDVVGAEPDWASLRSAIDGIPGIDSESRKIKCYAEGNIPANVRIVLYRERGEDD
jgi:hypothetical protein